MLVLMRKAGESIMIGDNIIVTIVCVNGNQVRMAIAAPKAVSVDREEIYIRKRQGKTVVAALS